MGNSLNYKSIAGVLFVLFIMAFSYAGCGEKPSPKLPALTQLTPQLRDRIDRLADQAPVETAGQKRIDFSGNIFAWVISQVVLTPDQERQYASAVHETILGKVKTIDTPEPAEELLQKLTKALPEYLKPSEFDLTTIQSEEVNAFTCGRDFVYVLRPLLDALLNERSRAEGPLAFVLAHEIGHVVLGHCRRGYQRERIEAEINNCIAQKIDKELLDKILQTGINAAGHLVKFTYSREQEYEADLFALHLCRNAGMELDTVLDAFRWLVLLQHPRMISEPGYVPADGPDEGLGAYFLSSHPSTLRRLRRLRMELAGTLPDETSFGIFAWEPASDTLTKAGNHMIGEGERALVLIHGMGGNEKTFSRFRDLLGKELPAKVLEFRYPNNGSLAHAAAFLKREMRRVVRMPERAVFVAHGAGGLVFRAYAEKLDGRFDRAVFLGTPHRGSNMVGAKFLVDLSKFVSGLLKGILDDVDQTISEGDGQIGQDIHPDSLFLRWLGDQPEPKLSDSYHYYAGRYLGMIKRGALEKVGFPACRTLARNFLDKSIQRPAWVREAVLARVDALSLADEITQGDGVVSVASATAVGAGNILEKHHHLSLTGDEEIVKGVVDMLK